MDLPAAVAAAEAVKVVDAVPPPGVTLHCKLTGCAPLAAVIERSTLTVVPGTPAGDAIDTLAVPVDCCVAVKFTDVALLLFNVTDCVEGLRV